LIKAKESTYHQAIWKESTSPKTAR
jgi:hypothetical protein